MKISIDPAIANRIKSAWGKLNPDQQRQIAPALAQGNEQASAVVQSGTAPVGASVSGHQVLAYSALHDDPDSIVAGLDEGVVLDIAADGVVWGTGKYQQFDPGWVEAFAVYLETVIGGKAPFKIEPPSTAIPNTVRIALAGDWGTGVWRDGAPSSKVGQYMAQLNPDLTIHLGDVYYAGTDSQEQDYLASLWPKGSVGAWALNSNHEMYAGSKPYFQAIAGPPFGMQNGCSYFALENDNWVIVALDSAYFASEADLYLTGSLGPDEGTQVQFLQAQVAKNKKVIVLTHHNGLDDQTGPAGGPNKSTPNNLWAQVMSGFAAGRGPDYWYWGHIHTGVVYQPLPPQAGASASVRCRCCGHGGLPWAQPDNKPMVYDNNPNVSWWENRRAGDPDFPQRLLNGFAVISLDGPNISESFYDENGNLGWKQ